MTEKKQKPAEDTAETTGTPVRKKPLKYLREVSVVIIGVAVTFIGSDWISTRKAKNDLDRYLNAVKIELEDNLEIFREKADYYERLGEFAHYLASDLPQNLSRDTIALLHDATGNFPLMTHIFTLNYKSSAFEMLKTSGTMHLISDNYLFQSIMDAYAELQQVKNESDSYMSRKTDIIYETIMDSSFGELDILSPEYRRFFNFFAVYIDLDFVFKDSVLKIEETLSLL